MSKWTLKLQEYFFRIAAGRMIPSILFERRLPATDAIAAKTGPLHIELVSHCLNYSHFLRFQLSSFLRYPPKRNELTVTIIYCPEDTQTVELLEFYQSQSVENVHWNFLPMEKTHIYRRSIARNLRAKETRADWVFFSDCDQMFYDDAIDQLCDALQGRRDRLLFPKFVKRSLRVHSTDEVLRTDLKLSSEWIVEADRSLFEPMEHHKAVGGTQIVHGDVARAIGYCEAIPAFLTPLSGFQRTYDDQIFRWLIQSQGEALDVPHIYRIEHHQKGRYEGRMIPKWLRPVLSNAGRSDLIAKIFNTQPTGTPERVETQAEATTNRRRAA